MHHPEEPQKPTEAETITPETKPSQAEPQQPGTLSEADLEAVTGGATRLVGGGIRTSSGGGGSGSGSGS